MDILGPTKTRLRPPYFCSIKLSLLWPPHWPNERHGKNQEGWRVSAGPFINIIKIKKITAVSQICNLTRSPLILMVLILKSTPMVVI